MKISLLLPILTLAAVLNLRAAELAPADKDFLDKYEPVRAALAADDLAAAKKAAGSLPGAEKLAADSDLAAARKDFGPLSDRAVTLVKDVPGYHVIRCPMVNKQWVQTSKSISNPFMGKEMLTCGVVKS